MALSAAEKQPKGAPTSRSARCGRQLLLGALAVWLGLCPGHLPAQEPLAVKGRNFRAVPEYYPPPHEAQMKSLLEGAEAEQRSASQVLVTKAKLQTFAENGEPELVIETPQCLYDSQFHWVSSAASLHVRSADGRFSTDGEGFLWQQTNSSLTISNRVHTIVHEADALGVEGQKGPRRSAEKLDLNNAAPLAESFDIFSHRFNYAANTGLGTYSEDVRVVSTNLTLAANELAVVVPMRERRLEKLIARQNVVIDSLEVDPTGQRSEIHATGERAVYSADTGLIQLSEHPTWQAGQREGRGDQLLLDPTNKIFRVEGQAWFKMALPTNSSAGFLPALTPPAAGSPPAAASLPASNHFVEIQCDNYEIRTNRAVFRENVRSTDFLGDQVRGHLNCQTMTASISGTNQLQDLVALTNVVIEQEDTRFTGGRAVYTATNGLVTMTESPAWQAGLREGRGEVVVVDPQREEMNVRGQAFLRLPANQIGLEPGGGPGAPKPAVSTSGTNEFAEIFCEAYQLGPENSRFERKVRIEHPRMTWACEEITVDAVRTNRTVSRMVADHDVVFDLTNEKGQKVHGTGDQAVYTCNATALATNEVLELTGNALLQTTNGTVRNRVLILDRVSNTIVAPGRYRFYGQTSVVRTNASDRRNRHF
jgi:lipopolysaccharide export system protein LptA